MERSRRPTASVTTSCAGCSRSAGGEIQEKLRSIREEIPSYQDEVRDAEEQSVTDFAQEMDFALMEMKAQTLIRIDEALQRVDAGDLRDLRRVRAGHRGGAPQGACRSRCSAVDCQEREETRPPKSAPWPRAARSRPIV